MVREFNQLSYEERLKELDLPTLKDRRTRGDMILTYRLIHGKEGIDYRKFFTLAERSYNIIVGLIRVNSDRFSAKMVRWTKMTPL